MKSLREQHGLSIEAFSKRSGISVARLKKLETPEGDPRLDDLARIASTLRMRVSRFAKLATEIAGSLSRR
ncbi:MAG: helix-turn-helix domain-containing protein [Steroidobacteraceae bacterium]